MSLSESPVCPCAEPSKTHGIWLLRDLAVGVLVPSLLGAFGAWHQLLDLCSHFRLQYLALLSVLAVLLAWQRSWRWTAISLLGVLHNAVLIAPYYPLVERSMTNPAETLSLVSFNVHTSNRRSADVLKYLQRKDPDLILLIEVDHRWIREVSALEASHPYHILQADSGNFGLALYSKLPLLRHTVRALGPDQPVSLEAELKFNGRTLRFCGTHPWPPMTPEMFRSRNEQLAAAAVRVMSAGMPTLVAGDLNATPWCVGMKPLFAAGLNDTAMNFGIQRTWNSKIPMMRIPIDHVLATKEFVAVRREVGPACGSDHYAVEADLQWR